MVKLTWKEFADQHKDAWAHMPKRSREEFIYTRDDKGTLFCDYAGEGTIIAKWYPLHRKWVNPDYPEPCAICGFYKGSHQISPGGTLFLGHPHTIECQGKDWKSRSGSRCGCPTCQLERQQEREEANGNAQSTSGDLSDLSD